MHPVRITAQPPFTQRIAIIVKGIKGNFLMMSKQALFYQTVITSPAGDHHHAVKIKLISVMEDTSNGIG